MVNIYMHTINYIKINLNILCVELDYVINIDNFDDIMVNIYI